jgi:hypothetical protein
MGREIRMVPKDWIHPKRDDGSYHPLFNSSATEDFIEFLNEFEEFKKGDLNKYADEYNWDINDPYAAFCGWNGGAPDPEYRRPLWDKELMTCFQMYETVSEGTPVSPVFESKEELVVYLVENGDYWDQSRRKKGGCSMNCEPWSRQQAENFVKAEWKPSFIIKAN